MASGPGAAPRRWTHRSLGSRRRRARRRRRRHILAAPAPPAARFPRRRPCRRPGHGPAGRARGRLAREDRPAGSPIRRGHRRGCGRVRAGLRARPPRRRRGRGRPSPACRARRPGRRRTGARPCGPGPWRRAVAQSGRAPPAAERPAGSSEDGPVLMEGGKGFGKHDPRRAYRGCRDQGDEPHSLREHRFQHHRGPGAPARRGRAIEGDRSGQTTSHRCETCRLAGRTNRRARAAALRHATLGAGGAVPQAAITATATT